MFIEVEAKYKIGLTVICFNHKTGKYDLRGVVEEVAYQETNESYIYAIKLFNKHKVYHWMGRFYEKDVKEDKYEIRKRKIKCLLK